MMTPTCRKFVAFSRAHKWLVAAVSLLLSGIATLFISTVIVNTTLTAYGPDHIAIGEVWFGIFRTDTAAYAHLRAEVDSDAEIQTLVTRELVHQASGEVIILPSSERRYYAGKQEVRLTFPLNMTITNGRWCLTSTLRYKRFMSLVDRVEIRTLGCADVEPAQERFYLPEQLTGASQ